MNYEEKKPFSLATKYHCRHLDSHKSYLRDDLTFFEKEIKLFMQKNDYENLNFNNKNIFSLP